MRTFEDCVEPGLYLFLGDGRRVNLTRSAIEAITRQFLCDSSRLPLRVKQAAEYTMCKVCPERYSAEICHAVMPALPFVDQLTGVSSWEAVTAVYRSDRGAALQVVETTVQQALKFLTIMSLTQYCEVGRQFSSYFRGVDPLMDPDVIAGTVYQNLVEDHGGDVHAIRRGVAAMRDTILVTTSCQVDRIRLICRSDALVNAFISTQSAVEWLFIELEERMAKRRPTSAGTHAG